VLTATLTRGALVPPVGEEVWRDTAVVVNGGESGQGYADVFTGARVETTAVRGRAALPLAQALARFPVAALLKA
jgi:maltooligosyltrehalose synthase